MENRKEITVEEALKQTAAVMANLKIPAGLVTELGVPLEGCIRNLNLCIDALAKQREIEASAKDMEENTDEREADV